MRTFQLAALSGLIALAAGCSQNKSPESYGKDLASYPPAEEQVPVETVPKVAVDPSNASGPLPNEAHRADNTAQNVRDLRDGPPTPMDQSNDPQDLKITAQIRRAIMNDKSMSFYAQNVKIITANKVVTLRGPVSNEVERSNIMTKAYGIEGVTKVINMMDLKSP